MKKLFFFVRCSQRVGVHSEGRPPDFLPTLFPETAWLFLLDTIQSTDKLHTRCQASALGHVASFDPVQNSPREGFRSILFFEQFAGYLLNLFLLQDTDSLYR